MRPVQLADIEVAARVLMPIDPPARFRVMTEIVDRAVAADRYRKTCGRAHPDFGCGTLMSAAERYEKIARPVSCGRDYLACVVIVASVLTDRHSNQFL